MNIENDLNHKADAIKIFINQKPKVYLGMIHKAKIRLGAYLGFSEKITSIAEGIMHEIFGDIIDGTRAWDMETLKLEQVLWTNIKSEVSARVKKEIRYISTPVVSNAGEEKPEKSIDDLVNTKPEDVEGTVDAETIEAYCLDVILKDDYNGQIVFIEMLAGKKQKQIAEYLRITLKEAETFIRSIRRKISKQIPRYMLENLPKQLITKILNQT